MKVAHRPDFYLRGKTLNLHNRIANPSELHTFRERIVDATAQLISNAQLRKSADNGMFRTKVRTFKGIWMGTGHTFFWGEKRAWGK